MVDTRLRPIIGSNSVRSALEGLLFQRDQENPLFYLTLVDQFLNNADLPLMDNPRRFALHNILISIISQELSSQRQTFQLEAPYESDSLKQAENQIQLDGQQQTPELVGWSLLYYRYVRVDLNISPSQYAELANIDPRTFRRHQRMMIEGRLPDILADAEWQARTWHRQLRLHSVLPNADGIYFVGRQQMMKHMLRTLDEIRPQHVLITGAKGIGKTTFVDRVLRQMINADVLDYIIWIPKPRSASQIRHLLHQELHHHDTPFSIRDYSLVHRIAIVLDDISALDHQSIEFGELWQGLSDVVVFITNLVYVPLSSDVRHIVLPEITHQSAKDLIHLMRPDFSNSVTESYANKVWQYMGGNPFAIKMLMNANNNLELASPLVDRAMVEGMFLATYSTLDSTTKAVLCMLNLFPPEAGISISTLQEIWPTSEIFDSCFTTLLSCGFVRSTSSDEYSLIPATQQFIRGLYAQDSREKFIVDQLVYQLHLDVSECFVLIEHILLTGWPPVDHERAQIWLELCFSEGLRRGRYAVWLEIADRQETDSTEILLNRAICLRRLGQAEQTKALLNLVISNTGSVGAFDLQGRALIEFAGLLRQQGLYEAAQGKLQRINITDQNTFLIALERAQIAFERGDAEAALNILEQRQLDVDQSVRGMSLLSEIYLRMGFVDQSEHYILSAIEQAGSQHFAKGRLKAIRARILEAKGSESRAAHELALSVLEHEGDRFGLARCKTNFAACLIEMGRDLDLARRLLVEAERDQRLLNDAVGLLMTHHNLAALDRTII